MPTRTADRTVIDAPPEKIRRLRELQQQAAEARKRQWTTPGKMAAGVNAERPNRQTPMLDLIDDLLVEFADAPEGTKVAVFAPPQSGKSERLSRRFPLWLLLKDPSLRIGIVSYSLELAVRWGRQIKHDIGLNPGLGLTLRVDSQAAGRWETAEGGGIFCVGIGGGITGKAVDLLIIDDPVKGRAEAESEVKREAAWSWWENDAKVRARKTLLIQTRWHTDDLAGRVLTREPGEWRKVSIPAIAEADDALGRQPGEELQTPGWELGHYAGLQATTSPYVWASLYQQHPTAAEGGIFKRGDWRYWTPATDGFNLDGVGWFRHADCTKFITIDLATSTKTSADYTVASVWAIPVSGDLVLLDRVRQRVPETDHAALIAPLRQRWLTRYDVTYIESRMFGTTLVYALGKAGVPVAELEADVDKLTRALPYAGLVRQHKVWLPADAVWLDEWLDEHADFPNVAHDDQVDTGAYAARVAITHWLPQMSAAEEDAYRSSGPPEIDFMTVAM